MCGECEESVQIGGDHPKQSREPNLCATRVAFLSMVRYIRMPRKRLDR